MRRPPTVAVALILVIGLSVSCGGDDELDAQCGAAATALDETHPSQTVLDAFSDYDTKDPDDELAGAYADWWLGPSEENRTRMKLAAETFIAAHC